MCSDQRCTSRSVGSVRGGRYEPPKEMGYAGRNLAYDMDVTVLTVVEPSRSKTCHSPIHGIKITPHNFSRNIAIIYIKVASNLPHLHNLHRWSKPRLSFWGFTVR